jgi:hypothetical protein
VKNVADSGESLNGVLNPLENYYVTSAPCVPNTYNDVCAHTIKYFAKNGPSNKAQCKACPDGYHTEGRSGAWYCLPPAGNIFSNAEFLDKETYDTAIEQGESPIAVSAGKLNFTKKDGPSLPKMIAPPGSAAAEIAAPVKREEKPKAIAAKAPSKSGLSTLVDEWGDDK